MLYLLYSTLGYALYALLVLLLPLTRFGGRYSEKLEQRLGWYPSSLRPESPQRFCIWIHASSVGEVQAALILIEALLHIDQSVRIVLSTTTVQGQKIALGRLSTGIACVLAPLDVPPAVHRACRFFHPDLYIGLETELWPVLLGMLAKLGVPKLLLNGRLSERSCSGYLRFRSFFRPLVAGFRALAVITPADRERFIRLGVPAERVVACGNLKYDMPADNGAEKRAALRRRLGVDQQDVFICGSTHEHEEELLWQVVRRLSADWPLCWVVAPRHLERIPAILAWFAREGIECVRYSTLPDGGRNSRVVLVDTMGDLADLYAAGDYLFCGGSLVARGGHNIMEAGRWGRPVYFGPSMRDFKDAAELLKQSGGGFQVADADALCALMREHHAHPEVYRSACQHAAEAAASQRGAVARQIALVRPYLPDGPQN